ncbi:MAG: TonB family protein [Bacteroidota bacterium]
MLIYLLQVSCLIVLVYGLYYWSLQRMTHHGWTRVFLLVGLCCSWVLPQVSSYLARAEPITAVQTYLPIAYGTPIDLSQISVADTGWGWQEWVWLAYGVVCLLMLIRLLIGIGRIFKLFLSGRKSRFLNFSVDEAAASSTEKFKNSVISLPFTLIINPNVRSPFSFFNCVFVAPNDLEQHPDLIDRLLQHEGVHVRQMHSLDLLLVELSRVVLWWHPILPAYKRAVRQSHEYEADATVLRERQTEKQSYGHQLLSRLNNPTRRLEDQLANQFYHSFISKRLQMMNSIPTPSKLRWKYALIIPILLVGVFLFSGSSTATAKNTDASTSLIDTLPPGAEGKIYRVVEQMPVFPIAGDLLEEEDRLSASEQSLLRYIASNVKYPKEARDAGAEGMAVVSFVIEKDGSMSNFNIVRDPGVGMGQEAKRVMEQMQADGIRWQPGQQAGQDVRVKFNMPIRFKLDSEEAATNMEEGEVAPDDAVHVMGYSDQDRRPVEGDAEIFRVVEQMPLFPGGEGETYEAKMADSQQKLMMYLFSNIKYPKEARDAGVEGMAVVSFVVEKDGSLSEVRVLRDPGAGTGAEGLRVVEKMNDDDLRWEPGIQRGVPVRVQFNLPIRFKLNNEGRQTGIPLGEDVEIRLTDPDADKSTVEYFIDGEHQVDLGQPNDIVNRLDPNDIERISVIKEESEVALMRRKPETTGIILIQTKKGTTRNRNVRRGALDMSEVVEDNTFQAQFATLEEGIQVSYQLGKSDAASKLHIFDVNGRLLETRPFTGSEIRSTVNLQQRGVYIFRIEAEGQAQSYKVSY